MATLQHHLTGYSKHLPYSGTVDCQLICDTILNEVDAWLTRYHGYSVVIGGDFNVNMDFSDSFSNSIRDFVNCYRLLRCDDLFPSQKRSTYVNVALNHNSVIDYIFVTPDMPTSLRPTRTISSRGIARVGVGVSWNAALNQQTRRG